MKQLSEFFKVLGDPTRMKMVKLLQVRDFYVCELARILEISQPGISQHLARLKTLGIVKDNRMGLRMVHSINDEAWAKLESQYIRWKSQPADELRELRGACERLSAIDDTEIQQFKAEEVV